MRCRAALAVVTVLALAGCTEEEPRMPVACTATDAAGYARALRAAPGTVRLPGGVRISACTRRVRNDADLQILGTTVHVVAENLAARARDRDDTAAARRLGYLTGAVAAGAARSNGVSAELARRIGVAGTGIDEASPAVARAFRQGLAAGEARG